MGLRHWYESTGVLRGGGNRISRRYYALHELTQVKLGEQATLTRRLARTV